MAVILRSGQNPRSGQEREQVNASCMIAARLLTEVTSRTENQLSADSRFAPSQWETSLQSNAVSHWLDTKLESALKMASIGQQGLFRVNISVGCELLKYEIRSSWWRHQMGRFSALLALCAGNSRFTGDFRAQKPVTRSFDVFFDLHPNKGWSKQ